MGRNLVILASHKIHFTLKKNPFLQYFQVTKYNLHWKRGPIYAILAYRIEPTLEKKTHPCNTYISNATYIGKGSPSMQYLHNECNLHWKKGPSMQYLHVK